MMRGKIFWLALLSGLAWLLYRALRQSQQLVPVRYTPSAPAATTTPADATVVAAPPTPEPVVAAPVLAASEPQAEEAPVVGAADVAEATDIVEAYCVRCKERRLMVHPEKTITTNGRHAMRGSCPICGAKLFRFIAG